MDAQRKKSKLRQEKSDQIYQSTFCTSSARSGHSTNSRLSLRDMKDKVKDIPPTDDEAKYTYFKVKKSTWFTLVFCVFSQHVGSLNALFGVFSQHVKRKHVTFSFLSE